MHIGNHVLAQESHDNDRVLNVKYNRYHDQLVLSSSTDTLVNLWNIPSVSSVALSEGYEISK